jgi:predicted lactoylglutathione lyase
MTKQVWLNLPVKNLDRSTVFYKALGFTHAPHGSSEVSTGFMVGEHNFVVMLFLEEVLKKFVRTEIADATMNAEMCISIDAESREEVDALAKTAADAGGTIYAPPTEDQGWMYGCGFADPDGHRWNVLYMDKEKMPRG